MTRHGLSPEATVTVGVASCESGTRGSMTDQRDARPWVPAPGARTPEALRDAAHRCHGCELYRRATQPVMGRGSSAAPYVLVGEQPGDKEDLAGEPFVGPAGKVLDEALQRAGIEPDEVFTTNAVKHFRFRERGKRRIHQAPGRTQIVACRPWLIAEIEMVRPEVVVLLGASAGKAVFGPTFRVGRARGAVLDWPVDQLPIGHTPPALLATVHPSAVLRGRERREELLDDLVECLQHARRLLDRGA